jgi:hypothetical protein
MSVFDTWLDNRDRHNHGNLLITLVGGSYSSAYIDYSFSLSYGWGEGEAPPPNGVPRYPVAPTADVAAAANTLRRIEQLEEATIRDVVSRVPGEYLKSSRQKAIADGLPKRRHGLRAAISAMYGSGV